MTRDPGQAPLFGMSFFTGAPGAALDAALSSPAVGARLAVTANVDHVVSLSRDAAFRAAYTGAAVRTLDGMPLVWLARMRGARSAGRVTGHDLLAALLARGPSAGRVFALAPSLDVACAFAARLAGLGWPAEAVATAVPPFGFERDDAEGARLAELIRLHRTDWLLMGVGAPKSEIWVSQQSAALGAPVALCVGDALAVAAGMGERAPKALQARGLEWAWRFVQSPRRLFARYFIRAWLFPSLALRNQDFSMRPRDLSKNPRASSA